STGESGSCASGRSCLKVAGPIQYFSQSACRASGSLGRCEKWARSSNMIARGVWQLEQFGRFVDFVARTLAVLPRAVVERFGEVVWQFEQVAVRSLPIVLGAGISVGLVTWLQ